MGQGSTRDPTNEWSWQIGLGRHGPIRHWPNNNRPEQGWNTYWATGLAH